MKKLLKGNVSLYSSLVVIVAVALVGIGFGVNAFVGQNDPTTVIETANIEVYNEAGEGGDSFGAMTSPDISSPYLSVNGDTIWHIAGDMIDASTTVVSIDPSAYGISVTSSTLVSMVRLRVDTVATSTALFVCGASAGKSTAPTYDLMTTGSLATSTGDGCIMENGLLTADNGDSRCPDGGTIKKITLGPTYPYFVCNITATMDGGYTNANNTFDGKFMIRLEQMR